MWMDVSLALTIGAYSLDKSPQIQANTLLIWNYFLHIIIFNSYANGGQGRFSFGISLSFFWRIIAAFYSFESPSISAYEFRSWWNFVCSDFLHSQFLHILWKTNGWVVQNNNLISALFWHTESAERVLPNKCVKKILKHWKCSNISWSYKQYKTVFQVSSVLLKLYII